MRKPKAPKTTTQTDAVKTDSDEVTANVADDQDSPAETADEAAAKADATSSDAGQEPAGSAPAEAGAEPEPEAETVPEAEAPASGARAEPLPSGRDAEPKEPPRPDETAEEEQPHDEEHGHRSLAATALMLIVGLLVVASLTLWAAPKVAPHLPASVARYLMPGQVDTEARLAALDAGLAAETAARDGALSGEVAARDAAIAGVNAELAALGARIDAAADASQTEAALAAAQSAADAAAAARKAADGAAASAAVLASRLDGFEAELAALRGEFSAVSEALSAAGEAGGATSAETAAALAALGARIDGLAALAHRVDDLAATVAAGPDTGALEQQIVALAERVAAVEASAADAQSAQSAALGEVTAALDHARLQGAVDVLASRLTGGLPYAAKLAEIAAMTGAAPPEALAAGAETGLATADTLVAGYSRHAQAAVAADVRAESGEGTAAQALGWMRALVAGRPTTEQEGDSAGAITSRIAARIEEGKLAEALAEAETLSAAAQEGLGRWLAELRARVAAESALAEWRTAIGAGG